MYIYIDIEFWWFHETVGRNSFESHHHTVFFRQENVQGFWVPDLLKTWQIHQRHPYLSIFTSKKHPLWGWYHKFMASWLRGLCLGSIKHSWIFQGSQKHRRVPVGRFYINGLSCFQWPLGYAPMLAIEHIPQISIQNSIDVFPLPQMVQYSAPLPVGSTAAAYSSGATGSHSW